MSQQIGSLSLENVLKCRNEIGVEMKLLHFYLRFCYIIHVSSTILEHKNENSLETTGSRELEQIDDKNLDDWWEINKIVASNKEIMNKNPILFHHHNHHKNLTEEVVVHIRHADNRDENGIHSCYDFKSNTKILGEGGSSRISREYGSFCYPKIIVSGHPKCGTSAMYALLAMHPSVISSRYKENCLFQHKSSIFNYFSTLPSSIKKGKVLVGGCINMEEILFLHKLLFREPKTLYVVSVE